MIAWGKGSPGRHRLQPGSLTTGIESTYRCYLPVLAGFIAETIARPGLQHRHQTQVVPSSVSTQHAGQPRVRRVSGYRGPPALHLARPRRIAGCRLPAPTRTETWSGIVSGAERRAPGHLTGTLTVGPVNGVSTSDAAFVDLGMLNTSTASSFLFASTGFMPSSSAPVARPSTS